MRCANSTVGKEHEISDTKYQQVPPRHEELFADPGAFSLTTVIRTDTGAMLRDVIHKLPKSMQEVITLRDLKDMTISQAATRLGLTVSALKTRHFRARRQLKRHLLKKSFSPSFITDLYHQ
jgi:DNA-directed RNA polymerase specialized sigma24 family protein